LVRGGSSFSFLTTGGSPSGGMEARFD
jgi:hypothetical protein